MTCFSSTPIEGFVYDYCNVIAGLLDLYEACYDCELLRVATRLQDTQNTLFWDSDAGGYYSNSDRDPSVVMRLKDGENATANRLRAYMY